MTLTEFPVVDPAPGSVLVRVSRANVCGSDLHFWRGDARLQSWNRQDGAIIGHEKTGVVYALGDGVSLTSPVRRWPSVTASSTSTSLPAAAAGPACGA